MKLEAVECPRCNNPLNGRKCGICGCNPSDVEVVHCYKCDTKTTKEQAEIYKYQHPVSARYTTEYYCSDCR